MLKDPLRLAVITGNYPSPKSPTQGTFVKSFVRAATKEGARCVVFAPVPIHKASDSGYPKHEIEDVGAEFPVEVYRPRYLSLSAWRKLSCLGRLSPTRVAYSSFTASIQRCARKHNLQFDAIYGHFIYFGGAAAVALSRNWSVPATVGVGEGELWTVDNFGDRVAARDLSGAAGFVVGNQELGATLSRRLDIPSSIIKLLPNGVDLESFYPRGKAESRVALGLPNNRFIVSSVGNFLFKKGVCRVAEAITGSQQMGGIYAGSGPVPPVADNTLISRRVSHSEVPVFLSASDVFVLPTMVEGSSNAVIEAMACGLPIISSRGAFNDEILGGTLAIRVDPLDVEAIRSAVDLVRNDPALAAEMSRSSLAKAQSLSAKQRASALLQFIGSHRTYMQ